MDADFEDFVRGALPALRRYAVTLAGDRHAAEDLLQDTLVKVGAAWRRVRRDGNPVAYAKAAMVNSHVSSLRWRARRTRLPDSHLESGSMDAGMTRVEDRDQVLRALDALPPVQRAVLVLGYLEDLDDSSIARVLHRREATVRTLRRRALLTLRSSLPAPEPAPTDVRESR